MGKLKIQEVGKRIAATGMTQREFAANSHIPASTLNTWLAYGRNLKFKNAVKLAVALNCKVEDISNYKTATQEDYQTASVELLNADSDRIFPEGINEPPWEEFVEDFRKRALSGILKMEIDSEAKIKVMTFLDDLPALENGK